MHSYNRIDMCRWWLIFWISINLNVTFSVIHVTFISIKKLLQIYFVHYFILHFSLTGTHVRDRFTAKEKNLLYRFWRWMPRWMHGLTWMQHFPSLAAGRKWYVLLFRMSQAIEAVIVASLICAIFKCIVYRTSTAGWSMCSWWHMAEAHYKL